MRHPEKGFSFGTAMRCAMTLLVLFVSLAKGAMVMEIRHDHRHDHVPHHGHQHSHEDSPADRDDNQENLPDRDGGSHTHLLVIDMGSMTHPQDSEDISPETPLTIGGVRIRPENDRIPEGPYLSSDRPPLI